MPASASATNRSSAGNPMGLNAHDTRRMTSYGSRRCRVGAHVGRARLVHDPGAGLLLRGDGPAPKRAQHVDDELLVPARRPPGLGGGRVLAGLQRHRLVPRQPRLGLPGRHEHHPRGRWGRRREAAAHRGVPRDVRGDHPGPHLGGGGGPHEVRGLGGVRADLGRAGLLPGRVLDLRRLVRRGPDRLAGLAGVARLRRRHGDPHQRGDRRAGRGDGAGQAQGLAPARVARRTRCRSS